MLNIIQAMIIIKIKVHLPRIGGIYPAIQAKIYRQRTKEGIQTKFITKKARKHHNSQDNRNSIKGLEGLMALRVFQIMKKAQTYQRNHSCILKQRDL